MKKYRVFIVIGIFIIILGGVFFNEQRKSSAGTQSKNQDKPSEQFIVGVLQPVSHPALDEIRDGVQEGLAKNGYTDGKNIKLIFQNAQGDQSKLNTMATSLLDQKSAVLIGIGTPASQALANVTTEVPIIMGAVADPVKTGLVESNERPGGNITGVKNETPILDQMKLIKEIMPEAKKIGLLYSSGEDNSKAEAERATAAALDVGLDPTPYTVSNTNDITQMVATICSKEDIIYLPTDNTIASAMEAVVNEANRYNKAVIPPVDQMVAQGGLATVGISQYQMGVETGRMAAEVLAGKSKPADTPTYVLKKGRILINQDQAKKINVEIPQEILEKAEIVEPANKK